jgi:hypothetical protein
MFNSVPRKFYGTLRAYWSSVSRQFSEQSKLFDSGIVRGSEYQVAIVGGSSFLAEEFDWEIN